MMLCRTVVPLALLLNNVAAYSTRSSEGSALISYEPPPGHDSPQCSAKSEAPTSMHMRQIRYAHDSAARTARLELQLTNVANNHTSVCIMDGAQFAPPGPAAEYTRCDGEGDTVKVPEKYELATRVLFDRDTGYLSVNQTWYCDDVSPEYPIGFHGQAETTLQNLTCTTSETGEDCTAPDVQVYLWVYERFDLPPNALRGE